jgi:hypothetical protein
MPGWRSGGRDYLKQKTANKLNNDNMKEHEKHITPKGFLSRK